MNRNASPFSAQLHNIAVDSSQVLIAGQRLVFQWNWTNLAIVAAEVSRRAEGCSDELVALVGGVMATSPIVEAQPSWRLSNDDDADAAGTHQAEPTHDGPPILTEWWTQRDPFAWYVPAHNGTNDYGIHFDSCKLSAVARKLADIAPNAGLAPGDWLIGAIEMALWHEVTHAWVEDLVSLAESITGSDFYTPTNRRYASYIFMEEAICNSSSAGMLKMFFQSHPDKASILGAVNTFMSQQPRGYCDFADLRWWSANQIEFQRDLERLLVRVYHIPPEVAVHVLRVFLDPTTYTFPHLQTAHLKGRHHLTTTLATSQYMYQDAYPMYLC